MTWILTNIGTIAVIMILAVVIMLIIRSMIRKKKMSQSLCGCNCASCPSGGMCGRGKPE